MQIRLNKNNRKDILEEIGINIGLAVGVALINEGIKVFRSCQASVIDIGEWDSSYNNVNRLLYEINPEKYTKHRIPTVSKETYFLSLDVTYFVRLDQSNYIKVQTYRDQKNGVSYIEQRLKIHFYGKNRYENRFNFIKKAARLHDEKMIHIHHLNEFDTSYNVLPHTFDHIILKQDIKDRIVDGLESWKNSKDWYTKNQLTYKIGAFLYGKPGTGKSTIVKAISHMFGNAPIFTVNSMNIMDSITRLISHRKRYDGTIIVLIEDFDMFFKSREELEAEGYEEPEQTTGLTPASNFPQPISQPSASALSNANQNYLFQMLDGVYSMDDTIYVATTNYKDRIDPGLIRYGRFDIQEELDYFNEEDTLKAIRMFGYDKRILKHLDIKYPIQPSELQSKIMEYRSKKGKKQ